MGFIGAIWGIGRCAFVVPMLIYFARSCPHVVIGTPHGFDFDHHGVRNNSACCDKSTVSTQFLAHGADGGRRDRSSIRRPSGQKSAASDLRL